MSLYLKVNFFDSTSIFIRSVSYNIREITPGLLFQDKDLRYRFIYNHFPSLDDEVIDC